MSKQYMNWWSAYTWCQAHGGQLASFASACPNSLLIDGGYSTAGMCPNLHGVGMPGNGGFTRATQGASASQAWCVSSSNSSIFLNSKTATDRVAICE